MIFEDGGKKTFVELPGATARTPPKKTAVKLGVSDGLNVEVIAGPRSRAPRSSSGRPRSSPRPSTERRLAMLSLNDAFRQMWRDVRSQKLRTFLTVFGIVWGTVVGHACCSPSARGSSGR